MLDAWSGVEGSDVRSMEPLEASPKSDQEAIPVLVADRHPITVGALRSALRQHPRLTFAAGTSDPRELVRLTARVRGAVCVVDPALVSNAPSIYRNLIGGGAALVLWSGGEGATVPRWDPWLQAILLSKRSDCTLVLETLVHARKLSSRAVRLAEWIALRGLTGREAGIVGALRCGLQNKEIAARLGISPGTVKVHLHSIYRKLGIERRSELMMLADPDPLGSRLAALVSRSG
jgi:DNA-binding NarL/FixJ family response regulator